MPPSGRALLRWLLRPRPAPRLRSEVHYAAGLYYVWVPGSPLARLYVTESVEQVCRIQGLPLPPREP